MTSEYKLITVGKYHGQQLIRTFSK